MTIAFRNPHRVNAGPAGRATFINLRRNANRIKCETTIESPRFNLTQL
jgi:hypothetical protein